MGAAARRGAGAPPVPPRWRGRGWTRRAAVAASLCASAAASCTTQVAGGKRVWSKDGPDGAEEMCAGLLEKGDPYESTDQSGQSTYCPGNAGFAAGAGGRCPRCLEGGDWPEFLQSLGTGGATRGGPPLVLDVNDWLSQEMSSTIARILLEEVMEYPLKAVSNPGTAKIEYQQCCSPPIVNVEVWRYDSKLAQMSATERIKAAALGYEGTSALYVPQDVVNGPLPLAEASSVYLDNAGMRDLYFNSLPKTADVNCSDLRKNASLPCGKGATQSESNYQCDDEEWPRSSCTDGHFITPQCADGRVCADVAMANPTWDPSWFEALIINKGLNFSFSYYGYSGQQQRVKRFVEQGRNVIFYWWQPDPLVSLVRATPLHFPPTSIECKAGEDPEPTESTVNCAYPMQVLMKVSSAAVADSADLDAFFRGFQVMTSQINAIIATHTQAGGELATWEAACEWVRGNRKLWAPWISNNDKPPAEARVIRPMSDAAIIAVVLASAAGVAVCAALSCLVRKERRMRREEHRDVARAPRSTPCALIFTDLVDSTRMWSHAPAAMCDALDVHHRVIRECIAQHDAYEVKTIGDSFMIAAQDLAGAVRLACAVQVALNAAKWPADFDEIDALYEPQTAPEERWLWRGLRLRIGIHWGDPTIQLDEVTRGYDYYGQATNIAARMEACARSGQVLASQAVHEALKGRFPPGIVCRPAGEARFKGVAGVQVLWQLCAEELAARPFALLTADDARAAERAIADDDGDALSEPARRKSGRTVASVSTMASACAGRAAADLRRHPLLRQGVALETLAACSEAVVVHLRSVIVVFADGKRGNKVLKQLCARWRCPYDGDDTDNSIRMLAHRVLTCLPREHVDSFASWRAPTPRTQLSASARPQRELTFSQMDTAGGQLGSNAPANGVTKPGSLQYLVTDVADADVDQGNGFTSAAGPGPTLDGRKTAAFEVTS